MNLDGSNDTIICNTEGYNLEVYNNRLYFIVNSGIYSHGYLHYIDLNDPNYSVVKLENIRTSYFKIHDNKIIYRELSGFNYNNKSLSSCDLDGNNNTILVNDVDPTDFVIVNNNIYYNNDVINNYSINCYDMYKKSNYIIKKDVFAYGLQHLNGKLYYHSYLNGSGGVLGDGHYYELSLDGTVNRID